MKYRVRFNVRWLRVEGLEPLSWSGPGREIRIKWRKGLLKRGHTKWAAQDGGAAYIAPFNTATEARGRGPTACSVVSWLRWPEGQSPYKPCRMHFRVVGRARGRSVGKFHHRSRCLAKGTVDLHTLFQEEEVTIPIRCSLNPKQPATESRIVVWVGVSAHTMRFG